MLVQQCAHGAMYYSGRCVCSGITTGPTCSEFVPSVQPPSADACYYDVRPSGSGWDSWGRFNPGTKCSTATDLATFQSVFAFVGDPNARPYEAAAVDGAALSGQRTAVSGAADPFILHLLRTYGPWDAEDARLLAYFTGADALVRWDRLHGDPAGAAQDPAAVGAAAVAASPPVLLRGGGAAEEEDEAEEEHVGFVVMLSGDVALPHFRAWWGCWAHRSHAAFRFLVHLDAAAPAATRAAVAAAVAKEALRARMVPLRHSIRGAWGGGTLVYAQLLGTDALLRAFPRAAFVLNLSLHDVLLVRAGDLLARLRDAATDMIMPLWEDAAEPVDSARGGPPSPSRAHHWLNGHSHRILDLPATPWSIQATLWNASWQGRAAASAEEETGTWGTQQTHGLAGHHPVGGGVSVEWGTIQWSVLSRAAALALLRDATLVQLLLSLKATSVLDERFVGCAAVHLEARHGLRLSRVWRRWNGYSFSVDDAAVAFRDAWQLTARKVWWNRTDDPNAGTWRRVWQEVQPACLP